MGSKLTHTVSGNIASFRSADKTNIESLKVHFLPVQEGSGDPSPTNIRPITGWQGINTFQFGYNLMEIEARTTTNLGVTWTVNTDGIVTYEGTPTSWSSIRYGTVQLNGRTNFYGKILGDEDNVSFNTLYVYDDNDTRIAEIATNWERTTHDNAYAYVDLTDYPTAKYMTIALKRASDNIYMKGQCYVVITDKLEYLNIPITFPVLGKNKFDPKYKDVNEYTISGPYSYYYTEPIQLIPQTQYTIKTNATEKNDNWYLALGVYSGTYNVGDTASFYYILNPSSYGQSYTFTTGPSGMIRLATNDKTKFASVIDNIDIQLELGDTATTYEPYSSNNTVYSGYLDLVQGELVATYKLLTITGDENITYNPYLTSIYTSNTMFFSDSDSNTTYLKAICSHCPTSSTGYINSGFIKKAYNDRGIQFYNVLTNWGLSEVTSDALIAKLKEWNTNGTPLTICYQLETALHYPISKFELKTFLDQNNIWSNTNDITEVTYEVIDHLAQKRASIPKQRRKVLWNQQLLPLNSDNWQAYSSYSTATFNDGIATNTWTTEQSGYITSIKNKVGTRQYEGEIWYASYMIKTDESNINWGIEMCGGRQIRSIVTTQPGEWTQCSAIAAYQRGTNNNTYICNLSLQNGQTVTGITAQVKSPITVNLTTMFGKGNEPTKEEFEALCKLNHIDLTEYHPYTIGEEQIWYINDTDNNKYQTVEWNQYAKPLNANNYELYNTNYATVSYDNGVATRTITQATTGNDCYKTSIRTTYNFTPIQGHIYYVKEEINSEVDKPYVISYGGYWHTRNIIPNQWTTIEDYFTWNSTPSGGQPIYVCYRANASDVGEVCSTRNPIFIDVTQMFGAGNEPATLSDFKQLCTLNNVDLDSALSYNAGTQQIWRIK